MHIKGLFHGRCMSHKSVAYVDFPGNSNDRDAYVCRNVAIKSEVCLHSLLGVSRIGVASISVTSGVGTSGPADLKLNPDSLDDLVLALEPPETTVWTRSGKTDTVRCTILVEALHLWGAPKERRRRRAEKRSSKRVFWRVRFFSSHLRFSNVYRANLHGAEKKRTLQNTLLDDRFPARRLLRSCGAL